MRKKGLMSSLQNLTYLSQVGLSMITPLILLLLGSWWLVQKGYVGMWVYAVAIIFGIGAGACTFISFAKAMTKRSLKNKSEHETVPNEIRELLKNDFTKKN